MGRGHGTFDSFKNEAVGGHHYTLIGNKKTVIILGDPQHETQSLSIWPNPANDMLHFSGAETVNGEIFNVLGQKVQTFKTSPGQSLNVTNLSEGVYIIKTTANGAIRFVKS
jgi:hypothetical protein